MKERFRLGEVLVDPERSRLVVEGAERAVEPKMMATAAERETFRRTYRPDAKLIEPTGACSSKDQ